MEEQASPSPMPTEEKKKSPVIIIVIAVLAVLFLCGLCGLSMFFGMFSSLSSYSETSTVNESQDYEPIAVDETPIEDSVESPVEITVDITNFIAEYDENQISAEKKYTGTYITTNGFIRNISEDFTGKVFVSVIPENEEFYFGTELQCFVSDEADVLDLSNKSPIKIKGFVDDQDFGIVPINECEIL